jgi:hypothetical protein
MHQPACGNHRNSDMSRLVLSEPLLSRRDMIGRGAMALCALLALVATAFVFAEAQRRPADDAWVHVWRATALLMFAGAFGLLALRPRLSPGIWELTFFHKAMLAVLAFLNPSSIAAAEGLFDLGLTIVIGIAYGLTRGWEGWLASPVPASKTSETSSVNLGR